ncbi:hypothetical protein D5W64_12605 [Salmonella enterica subsp. enterica serovar Saintpaul]|nr:hypothetical protein [Salmonella enterica subsp. enterica serovar Saintpaul]
MELKQSSAVPFAVTDPISGLDITKDVQLVSIESVGEGDFPYFQPNGDYTFTVVNAGRDEIVTPTTFTLDVPYDGEVHRLTVTTDMTIQATQADFMKAEVIKPLGSVVVAPANGIFHFEVEATYRGKPLTAEDVTIQINQPGTGPITHPIALIGVTTKGDGKTLDIEWRAGPDQMVGQFPFFIKRKVGTTNVEGDDFVKIIANLRNAISGLRIGPIHDSSEHIRGHQGELINGWFVCYNNGVQIPLNDPGLTLTLTAAANINTIGDVIAIDEKFADHITFRIKGKPNGIDVNEPAGTGTGYFYLKATYKGLTAQVMPTLTWYPNTDAISPVEFIGPLFANQEQLTVSQFGAVEGNGVTPWYQIEGSKVRSGSILVSQFTGGAQVQMVTIPPGTPLNSINQLVKGISASWMKQRVSLSAVLDLPFITDPSLYQTMWRLSAQTVIEQAPVEFRINTDVITGVAGRYPAITISAYQMRDGKLVHVEGTFSTTTVTGAAAYQQMLNTKDGNGYLKMTTRGTSGDVLIKATFTSKDTPAMVQPVEITIRADNTVDIEYVPTQIPAKIWDVFSTPPFAVKSKGVNVDAKVTNVKVIKNDYVQAVEGDDGKWEIYNALTSSNLRVGTYFTYDVEINGVVYKATGDGEYNVAAWDGVSLTPNAEYIPGDRTTKVLTLPVGGNKDFTFYPTYKGKPAADKVELAPLGGNMFIRKQVLNEAGDGVIVTVGANTSLVTTNITFTYRIKGIPDAELVDKQTKVSEWVNIQAVPKGLSVVTANPTPEWAGLNATLLWKPVFRWDGVTIPNDDPNITVNIKHQETGVIKRYVTPVGAIKDTTYLLITTLPATNGAYTQYFTVDYVKDGVKYTSSEGNFPVMLHTSGNQPPITATLKDTPLANTNNLIPIEVRVGTNAPLDPKTIVPLAIYSKVNPENSDAVVGKVEYVNTGHLKFASGHMGGDVTFSMTFGSAGAPNTSIPITFNIPAAEITTTQTVSEINGITNAITQIGFTLSQERLISGTKQAYNFADAIIATTATVTGAVSSVTDIINTNGNFSANFVGKGDTGPGTATFKVTDPNGVVYDIEIGFEAIIDSTGFVLTLTPDTASGKKGDRLTFTGGLTLDGVNQPMDDSGLTWTTEPAGYLSMGMRNASDVRFDVTRSAAEIENVDVYLIVKDRPGHIAKHKVTLEILPNMEVTAKEYNVKVWDRVSGYPFIVKQSGTDITSQLLDIAHEPSEWLTDDTPLNWFDGSGSVGKPLVIITAEGEKPATTVVIPWSYRLPTEPVGVKHTVNVTYNVSEHNGWILTPSLVPFGSKAPLVIATGGTAEIDIVVLNKGKLVTTIATVGNPVVQEYATVINNSRFVSQVRLNMKAGTTEGYHGKQEHIVYPGALVSYGKEGIDYVVGKFEVNVWNASAPFKLNAVEPNPVEGRYGDEVVVKAETYYAGKPIDVNSPNITSLVISPPGTLELVPNSKTKEGFTVKFVDDIQVNSKETDLIVSMKHANHSYNSVVTLKVKQTALILKLTPAPGFESTGSGDVDNPVTLKQGVLNPE